LRYDEETDTIGIPTENYYYTIAPFGNILVCIGDDFTYHQNKHTFDFISYKAKKFLNAKLNLQWLTLNRFSLYNNTITKIQLGYTINTAYNFNVSLGYNYRFQDFDGFDASDNKTTFYTISLKSNLYNTYYDF
jgi:hypothetical protein